MGISIVGTGKASAPTNGVNVTLTYDTGSGAPQPGDVVIIAGGGVNAAVGGYPGVVSPAGFSPIYNTVAAAPYMDVSYKVMGSPGDIDVTGKGTGASTDVAAYAAIVLRGVDTVGSPVPFIRSGPSLAGPTASTNPDPPTVNANASDWVVAIALSTSNDTAITAPANYVNLANAGGNDNNDASIGIATREITANGNEDVGAFGSWTTGTWRGVSFSVRAKPADARVTVTLDNATVSAAAAVQVTTNLTQTLDDATLSAAASANAGLALTQTLADAALSSDVSVVTPITADLSVTLEDAAGVADADVQVGLALTQTLEDAAGTADADVGVVANVSQTLDDATLASTTGVQVTADVSQSLEAAALASTAGVTVGLDLSVTAEDVALLSDVHVEGDLGTITADLAVTLDDAALSADVSSGAPVVAPQPTVGAGGQTRRSRRTRAARAPSFSVDTPRDITPPQPEPKPQPKPRKPEPIVLPTLNAGVSVVLDDADMTASAMVTGIPTKVRRNRAAIAALMMQ